MLTRVSSQHQKNFKPLDSARAKQTNLGCGMVSPGPPAGHRFTYEFSPARIGRLQPFKQTIAALQMSAKMK
jgi:hypothetical protein